MTPEGGSLETWAYREAPYVFFRKGTYYFMWSVVDTGSANYHVAYGTSKSPLGKINMVNGEYPTILKQVPEKFIYGTAHNSVLQIPGKDKWYIVYHRINKYHIERVMSPGIHREVCIDELRFDKKGRIIPVQPTQEGPEGLK
jgi:beta-xylosidase